MLSEKESLEKQKADLERKIEAIEKKERNQAFFTLTSNLLDQSRKRFYKAFFNS